MPDLTTVRAFLDDDLVVLGGRLAAFASREIAPRPPPATDAVARMEAREILAILGRGGWYAPIARPALRAACLVRESLAAASPLADAVFALQALGTTPILLAGDEALRSRWLPEVERGAAMAAFA